MLPFHHRIKLSTLQERRKRLTWNSETISLPAVPESLPVRHLLPIDEQRPKSVSTSCRLEILVLLHVAFLDRDPIEFSPRSVQFAKENYYVRDWRRIIFNFASKISWRILEKNWIEWTGVLRFDRKCGAAAKKKKKSQKMENSYDRLLKEENIEF